MSKDYTIPQLGQITQIVKGRETGQEAIIIGFVDDRYVLLADGEKRKYDRPKKKNLKHVNLIPYISQEVRTSLLETNRVSNGKLRFAIAKYRSKVVTETEKGDTNDV